MTDRLLHRETLRDEYGIRVREDGVYPVVQIDPHGTRHEDLATPETASWLRDRLRGQQVDRTEAGEILAPAAERLDLPFTYGDKLGHYATKVLLVLVAREEAGVRKVGRRFIFTVYSPSPGYAFAARTSSSGEIDSARARAAIVRREGDFRPSSRSDT